MADYDRYEGGGVGGGGAGACAYASQDRSANGASPLHHHPKRGSWDYKDKYYDQDLERDKDNCRDKYRDQDHVREGKSHPKDDRDRRKEVRERSDHDHSRRRERSRGHERHNNKHDHGRERRHRHQSHSHSRGTSRVRSRSCSHSREHKSKRTSGFDMVPPGVLAPALSMPGQIANVIQSIPGVFPGLFPFTGTQLGVMQMQAATHQATRHVRKVYVGGLPSMVNEQSIALFFSQAVASVGGNTAGPGDAVVNVYVNHEKKFAFVEMRTVEEASNAMALDGIMFEGMPLRVRRPSDYNPSLAATLGPSQPSPDLNLAAVGLIPGVADGADADRIFIGGLPYYLTETQIKELFESFGPVRRFDLVKDRENGYSKGYGFCFYQDPAVTEIACTALNGLKMGEKTLCVRRANVSGQQNQSSFFDQTQHHIALQKLASLSSAGGFLSGMAMGGLITTGLDGMVPTEQPTKIVCFNQVVSPDELKNDEDFEDICNDMREECSKYGTVLTLIIPRPQPNGELGPGVGKVFVEYCDKESAAKAKTSLNGRKFGGNVVAAVYYSEDKFIKGEYDG